MNTKIKSSILIEDISAYVSQLDVFNHVDSAVCVLNTNHNIVFENPAFRTINHELRDSAGNFTAYDSLLSCPVVIASLNDLMDANIPGSFKSRYYYSRNIHVDISIVCTPIQSVEDGSLLGMQCTIGEESIQFGNKGLARLQDKVYELKNRVQVLDKELKGGRTLTRFLFKSSPVGIILFNKDGEIVNINRQAEALFNVEASRAIGKPCTDIINCYQACEYCPASTKGEKSKSVDFSERVETMVDGRPLLRRAVHFQDQGEDIILEAFMDIHELEQARLESRHKSEFLAHMSHEIRTPLTAIIGFTESLLTESFDEKQQRKVIETVVRNGLHLQQVINDVLDLSKIESGQLDIEQIDCSPFLVLGEVDSLLGMKARDKGLYLKINYHFPLPARIQTDPTRLKQILINLCSNAIKFTHEGGITIDVKCDSAFGKMQFRITDTGTGMTPAEVDHVFDAFTQADSSTTRKYGGTGLGLPISRSLADELGGSLECDSHKGKGSCFTLVIATNCPEDIVPVGSLEDVSIYHDEHFEQAEVRPLSGTILLAEDSPDNQQLISMYIRRTGAHLTIADDGLKAVTLAQERSFDLVIMDMQMPEMDGLTAITLLRDKGYTGPIVSLTANAMMSDRDRCIAAGADGYLSKPVNLQHFYEILNSYVPASDENNKCNRLREAQLAFSNNPKYKDMIKHFIRQLPQTIALLSDAIIARDWNAVRELSHDLKGLGGAMGYPQITKIAAELNELVKKEAYDQALPVFSELENCCVRIRE